MQSTPEISPPNNDPVLSLTRQLRALKIFVFILLLILAVGSSYYVYQRHAGQPVTIVVNGVPVGTVRNPETANRIIAETEKQLVGPAYAQQTPVRLQTIHFQRAASDANLDSDTDIQQALGKVLTVRVHAWVIKVDGKSSLGLPTQADASETLELVKQHFAAMPPAAQVVGDPQILQNITIKQEVISLERARPNPAAAAPYFWTPPPSKQYIVKPGDTGYMIAVRHHIPFSSFLAANSGQNMNELQPGDSVNVQIMPLLLSVKVKKTFVVTKRLLPHGPAAGAGLQQITYIDTYINGEETERNVSSASILKKPQMSLSL